MQLGFPSLVQLFNRVDSLQPHEPQHARPPCPSPTPGVHPNSCPLSWWCHPTISSSVVPFSSCPQSLPASWSFQMSQLCIRWPKYWSFNFNISPSSEHPGLISFRMALCKCRRHRRCGFDPWVRKIPWRRKWQPTPVILSGKSNRQRSLVGYSPWGCKELDMIEHAGTSCDLMAGRILFLILWFTLSRYNYKQTRFMVPISSTWLWLEKNLPQTFSAGIKMA